VPAAGVEHHAVQLWSISLSGVPAGMSVSVSRREAQRRGVRRLASGTVTKLRARRRQPFDHPPQGVLMPNGTGSVSRAAGRPRFHAEHVSG
jgi:hypothetical protein